MNSKILQGNCLEVLKTLPEKSVHCVVTSPPYWGLRNYGTEGQIWETFHSAECEVQGHQWIPWTHTYICGGPSALQDGNKGSRFSRRVYTEKSNHSENSIISEKAKEGQTSRTKAGIGLLCTVCGAWKGEFGAEPTPELYIEHLVMIGRELKRVLRDDGTFWLNLGDSFAGTTRVNGLKEKDLVGIPWMAAFALRSDGWYLRSDVLWSKPNPMPESVKDRPSKSHEYFFMLTKSKNYFFDMEAVREPLAPSTLKDKRNDTGRHTSEGKYFDNETKTVKGNLPSWYRVKKFVDPTKGRSKRTVWTVKDTYTDFSDWVMERIDQDQELYDELMAEYAKEARNLPDVWRVSPHPYRGAHFATFPPDLIKPCILASTSALGVCPTCGKPFQRIVKKGEALREWQAASGGDENGEYAGVAQKNYIGGKAQDASEVKRRILAGMVEHETVGWDTDCEPAERIERTEYKKVRMGKNPVPNNWVNEAHGTVGWQASCDCESIVREGITLTPEDSSKVLWIEQYGGEYAIKKPGTKTDEMVERVAKKGYELICWNLPSETVGWEGCEHSLEPAPSIVLDPFSGAGTTALACKWLEEGGFGLRDYIGIELNPDYIELSEQRIRDEKEPEPEAEEESLEQLSMI